MKVRDSGMPESNYWESLFDVGGILEHLEITPALRDVVELGTGYGTFTVPVARRISGTLHGFDIESAMITATEERVAHANLKNVVLRQRDVVADGFGLASESVDAVLLFNILHLDEPVPLLTRSAALLRPGGRVLAIHWRSDIPTPRGPDLSIRPQPEQINAWAAQTGLLLVDHAPRILPPWHFGVVLQRAPAIRC